MKPTHRLVLKVAVCTALCALSSLDARAQIVFKDIFDPENGGVGQLNYSAFTKWDINQGFVDLIGNGFNDLLPGNGLYLDMNGSGGHGGTIQTSNKYPVLKNHLYKLKFNAAGSHRASAVDDMYVYVIDQFENTIVDNSFRLVSSAPFATRTLSFVPSANNMKVFIGFMSPYSDTDNQGMLIDRVRLKHVGAVRHAAPARGTPEPGAIAALGAAVTAFGWGLLRPRRRLTEESKRAPRFE